MPDGKITFSTKIDNSNLEKDLKETKKKIEKSQKDIDKSEEAKMPLLEEAKELGIALDAARKKLEALKVENEKINAAMQPGADPEAYIDAYTRKGTLEEDIKAQSKAVDGIKSKWESVSAKVADYDRKIESATVEITKNKEKAAELEKKLAKGGLGIKSAYDKAGKAVQHFGKRLMGIASSAVVFSLVYRALNGFVRFVGSALQKNEKFRAELAKLKGELLTAFQPLYDVILPASIALLEIMTKLSSVIANVLSAMSGKTLDESRKAAKAFDDESKSLDKVGKSADKATKSLASFDAINTLGSSQKPEQESDIDFESLDTQEYRREIDALTVYLSGALLALGVILTFSGANIPLGLGLLSAGAAGLASEIKEDPDYVMQKIKEQTKVISLISGILLAIGIILLFAHVKTPLALGLVATGAVGLASAVAANWDYISEELKKHAAEIAAVSTIVLSIGIVLLFSGINIPLALGLIVAGSVGLAKEVSENWDYIRKSLTKHAAVIVSISAILVVLGIILCFTGAGLPLGIGLIVAGGIGLAAEIAANWDYLKGLLQDKAEGITAISAILVILGIILCFTGAGLPLGLGLIAVGGVGLAAEIAANWDFLLEKFQNCWKKIKLWWENSVAPIFTLQWWKDLFSCIGEGFDKAWDEWWNSFSPEGLKRFFAENIFDMPIMPGQKNTGKGAAVAAGQILPYGHFRSENYSETSGHIPGGDSSLGGGGSASTAGAGRRTQNININFTGDLAQLARVLKPEIDVEGQRIGSSLAKG